MNCFSKLILVAVLLRQLFAENLSTKIFMNEYVFWNTTQTYYRLYDTAVTWVRARQICEAEGTSLHVPNDLDEMEYIKDLIGNMKAHFTAVFIGMHDMFSKGDFVTIKGDPIADTIFDLFWGDGRPDDETGNERCIVMTRQGLFDDRPCDHMYPFVCEIHSNNTTHIKECRNNDDIDIETQNDAKYQFFPVANGSVQFKVRARNDAYVALTTGPGESLPMYEVIIGGGSNTRTFIRKNKIYKNEERKETPEILNGGEFRGFWLRWDSGAISAGREGEPIPFISWVDPEPFPIGFIGVATGWGTTGSWKIETWILQENRRC